MSPAQPDQISGIIQFDGPIYNAALVVLRVKIDLAMGIGPDESRNGSLQGDPFRKVVPLRAVMCDDRAGKNQKSRSQGKKRNQSTLHAIPPNHAIHGPAGGRKSY